MRMGEGFYVFCTFISKTPLVCYVLPPPPNPSAPPQGYCHAAAAGILGASQDALMAGCSRVAEDVARSPALLSRPAALCKRLGLCHGNCLVDGTTSNNTTSSSHAVLAPAKDAIDLCSPNGLVSGRLEWVGFGVVRCVEDVAHMTTIYPNMSPGRWHCVSSALCSIWFIRCRWFPHLRVQSAQSR
jgi:hypothetical protein